MPKGKGYWEEYKCGCVSETVPRKKDLMGYCPTHGQDRRHVWPENAEHLSKIAGAMKKALDELRKARGGNAKK